MLSRAIVYDGPFYLEEIRLISCDPDPSDWLKGVGDDELVSITWSNCTMILSAGTARSWLERSVAV